jgi:hypothetical protein
MYIVHRGTFEMNDYEWDENKFIANIEKPGFDFFQAIEALEDPFALTVEDPRQYNEIRFCTVGMD